MDERGSTGNPWPEYSPSTSTFWKRHDNIAALVQLFIGTVVILLVLFIAVITIRNVENSSIYEGENLTQKQQDALAMRYIEKMSVLKYGTWFDRTWFAIVNFGDSSLDNYEFRIKQIQAERKQQQQQPPIPEIFP